MKHDSRILRLREFESASIGATWSASGRVVTRDVAAEIERLQSQNKTEYLAVSSRRVTARHYVGVVGIGDRSIEILPKCEDGTLAARQQLMQMLSIAGVVPTLDAGLARLGESAPTVLDAVMQLYVRQLTLQWRRGRIFDYRSIEENRKCLRGKLLHAEQLRKNLFRPERFYTRASRFVVDVLPSQLLKAGLETCRRHGRAEATQHAATLLLAEFDDVATREFIADDFDRIVADRRIARFMPLLTLARRLVRGTVSDQPGSAPTYSLLFDMNAVFEQFIGNLLRSVCPKEFQVQLQVTGRSLVLQAGRRKFALRPDVGIRDGKQFRLLIDTKWKLLDTSLPHSGVSQADMYQVYAYAREYACPGVILLYPRYGDLSPCVANYQLHPGGAQSPRIAIRTVDVSAKVEIVREELRTMIRESLAGMP